MSNGPHPVRSSALDQLFKKIYTLQADIHLLNSQKFKGNIYYLLALSSISLLYARSRTTLAKLFSLRPTVRFHGTNSNHRFNDNTSRYLHLTPHTSLAICNEFSSSNSFISFLKPLSKCFSGANPSLVKSFLLRFDRTKSMHQQPHFSTITPHAVLQLTAKSSIWPQVTAFFAQICGARSGKPLAVKSRCE